jgi:Tfp pilus assembly protein PilO
MSKIITTFLCTLVAIGVFFGYTGDAYSKIETVQTEIAQFDQALNKSSEMQELKQRLLSRYNAFSAEDLNRLTHLLPDHVDNVRLVLDLDSLAAKYGMPIENVTVGEVGNNTAQDASVIGAISDEAVPYDSIVLSFSTRGSYESFVQLMSSIGTSLRIIDVTSIDISPESQGDNGRVLTYRYNVSIKTYWLK